MMSHDHGTSCSDNAEIKLKFSLFCSVNFFFAIPIELECEMNEYIFFFRKENTHTHDLCFFFTHTHKCLMIKDQLTFTKRFNNVKHLLNTYVCVCSRQVFVFPDYSIMKMDHWMPFFIPLSRRIDWLINLQFSFKSNQSINPSH